MRIDFKKIAAIGTGVLLTGMSMGVAAAAAYPSPFTSGSTAIVYGADAPLDMSVAFDLKDDLMGTSDGDGDGEVVEGKSLEISKSTDLFNLGNSLGSFYTTIDGGDLGLTLADGVYKNDGNDEFDYEQEVSLGAINLVHFTDNDFNDEEPVIGFNIVGGTVILNYTLDFSPDNAESDTTDWNEFEGTTIEMLGKEYYILSASNSSKTLEFLDSANDALVNSDETVTVETERSRYDVSIEFIDSDEVRLNVNGEVTSSLNEDDTYKLDSGDYVGIKEISFQDFQGGAQQVEFSIGSGKIELKDGEEIQVNGEDVSDLDEYEGHILTATVTPGSSGNELDKFTIQWKTDSGSKGDTWLAFDTDSREITMPVFNNLKLSLGEFVTKAQEKTSIDPDGSDSFTLNTEVADGEVSLNLLYANSTETGFGGIGESSSQKLLTNSSSNPRISWDGNSEYFVATWISGDDYESYVLEVTKIDDKTPSDNSTTIESVATGSNKAVNLDIGETDEIGEIKLELVVANDVDGTATIELSSASGSGSVTADKLVTAEGLKIQLPHEQSGNAGYINFTAPADTSSWLMNFTEEDGDGNIDSGQSFNVTLGFNDKKTSVTAVSVTDYETSDGSDNFVGYVTSDLATMTMFYTGGDEDNVDITYHGEEAYARVFLSEADVMISGGSGAKADDVVVLRDTEVSQASDKNLIIVGGSCINSAAASLVGGAYCGSDWMDETGVGSGQFLIQSFGGDDQTLTSKIAVLVAGYEAADTVKAADYLTNRRPDTAAGSRGVYSTSTSEEVVTA